MMMWPWPDDWPVPRDGRLPHDEDPDERLARQITAGLLIDDRTRRQRIAVEVQNRVVLLRGVVDTGPTREAATTVVRSVPGVRDICNGLRTRVSGPDDDEEFDEIVGDLDDLTAGRPAGPHGRSGVPLILLLAMVCLPVGALAAAFGPVAMTGAGLAAAVAVVLIHRFRHRPADRPR